MKMQINIIILNFLGFSFFTILTAFLLQLKVAAQLDRCLFMQDIL